MLGHAALGVGDGVFAEVEDARGQHCVRVAFDDALRQVVEVTDAAGGDHRDVHGVAYRTRERQVEAVARAVPVHAGEQQFAGAILRHLDGPFDGVYAAGCASAVGEYLPAWLRAVLHLFGVHGDDDALIAKVVRRLLDEIRTGNGGGVDGHLVGAGVQHAAHVFQAAYAAAHREGDEYLLRHGLDHVHHGRAVVGTGGDIEKGDFIRALLVVAPRNLHRVAGVADIQKAHAFHYAAIIHVETGDDAFCQAHGVISIRFLRRRREFVRQLLRRGKIQRAFVNGASGDGTDDVVTGDCA